MLDMEDFNSIQEMIGEVVDTIQKEESNTACYLLGMIHADIGHMWIKYKETINPVKIEPNGYCRGSRG